MVLYRRRNLWYTRNIHFLATYLEGFAVRSLYEAFKNERYPQK